MSEYDAVPAIDMHSHFWPASVLEAASLGSDYFGWTIERRADGAYAIGRPGVRAVARLPEQDLADPAGRIEMRMDQQAIGFEAVMISGFLWNYHLGEKESSSFARMVNDELAELERTSVAHRGLAHLPLPHTRAAIAEVHRVVGELGLRHFAVGTHFEGRNFDHPDIQPVLHAIAETGATLSIHPVYFDTVGMPGRTPSAFLRGGLGSPMEDGLAMASLIASGIFDDHPEFRVWVGHGGGAAMYAMGRLDRRWQAMKPAEQLCRAAPSDYLRRFWYGNLVHGERELTFLIDMAGSDRVTVGTDNPFQWDHIGGSANWIRRHPGLTNQQREEILWGNAARFLGGLPDSPMETRL